MTSGLIIMSYEVQTNDFYYIAVKSIRQPKHNRLNIRVQFLTSPPPLLVMQFLPNQRFPLHIIWWKIIPKSVASCSDGGNVVLLDESACGLVFLSQMIFKEEYCILNPVSSMLYIFSGLLWKVF